MPDGHWRLCILQQFIFPDHHLCIQIDVVPDEKVCDVQCLRKFHNAIHGETARRIDATLRSTFFDAAANYLILSIHGNC